MKERLLQARGEINRRNVFRRIGAAPQTVLCNGKAFVSKDLTKCATLSKTGILRQHFICTYVVAKINIYETRKSQMFDREFQLMTVKV
jgi:hypothetical protein